MTEKGKRLRPGNVVTIRINPTDCMSVVDVVKQAGVLTPGMSFASMVSLSLSSVMQTLRDQGIIPERDGFEYLEIVGPYISKQDARKIEISKTLASAGSRIKVSGLSQPKHEAGPTHHEEPQAPAEIKPVSTEQRLAGRRLTELLQKRDLAEHGTDVIWSSADQKEYDELYKVVYPEG